MQSKAACTDRYFDAIGNFDRIGCLDRIAIFTYVLSAILIPTSYPTEVSKKVGLMQDTWVSWKIPGSYARYLGLMKSIAASTDWYLDVIGMFICRS